MTGPHISFDERLGDHFEYFDIDRQNLIRALGSLGLLEQQINDFSLHFRPAGLVDDTKGQTAVRIDRHSGRRRKIAVKLIGGIEQQQSAASPVVVQVSKKAKNLPRSNSFYRDVREPHEKLPLADTVSMIVAHEARHVWQGYNWSEEYKKSKLSPTTFMKEYLASWTRPVGAGAKILSIYGIGDLLQL